jgi:hypothetical protein
MATLQQLQQPRNMNTPGALCARVSRATHTAAAHATRSCRHNVSQQLCALIATLCPCHTVSVALQARRPRLLLLLLLLLLLWGCRLCAHRRAARHTTHSAGPLPHTAPHSVPGSRRVAPPPPEWCSFLAGGCVRHLERLLRGRGDGGTRRLLLLLLLLRAAAAGPRLLLLLLLPASQCRCACGCLARPPRAKLLPPGRLLPAAAAAAAAAAAGCCRRCCCCC